MDKKVSGTVVAVKCHSWIKVNTKPLRQNALDGAQFAHTVKVRYMADGQEYFIKKWLAPGGRVPEVGEAVTVQYRADAPKKALLL